MKTTMYKVLCTLLVCVMVLGMMPMAALATEAQTELTAVKAWNLVLADEIAVNFHVSIENAGEDAVMQITDGYGTAEYPIASAKKNDDGTYLFTARLAAAQMADAITLQLIDGQQTGPLHTYTAAQYADAVLSGDYKQSAKDLVLAMINYGAAAQTYFGYNTENLANAGYEAEPTAEIPTVSGAVAEGNVNGLSLYGASLLLQSRVAVRFYFSGSVEGLTFSAGAPVEKDDLYYVDVTGINPQDYDKEITLTVTDGTDTMIVSYSPVSYISRQYAKTSNEALRNLVNNMYQYHIAAESYLVDGGSADVTTDGNGIVTEQVIISGENSSALVATGTQLEENTTTLTLSVAPVDETASDVVLGENEQLASWDVHVEGVAKGNTVPVLVTLDELAPEFLNKGNITLYHVENGETVEMTRVYSAEELDAHNEYYYDIATGTVTVAMASFSEVAVVANEVNPWTGKYDYTWYTGKTSPYVIYNADQLAGLSAIVGGMNGNAKDDFNGKTVKLMADINIGDLYSENGIVFYPIGYYNNTGSYEKKSGKVTVDGAEVAVSSNVSSFEGIFDGNGHTISNFYQNTWEMFGDYNDGYSGTPNHYKDAMGLFGYVYGGTVKNLNVDNFSSDGEFTPTGVIAAYACNATFENIAITNCNPRVYNTGNGGIVGIGGNDNDPDTYKLTFTNITIDNSNKITALWGSWDVACGGLVGMFRGAGHANMTNCHVAAQIDVYNDVCGNYQYYWYRYAGMMIGTNKNMVTDENGYTVPETSKYHAEGCTVHFGDWNDYYYCELVANSLASYTHDHQFSRLTLINSLDEIKSGDTWLEAGNFLLIKGENKTCYHIVNKDGVLTQHLHTDAGYEDSIDEDNDGRVDLKEDKQIVYLPFNQLFTGYGWGVKHIPVYNGEDYAFKGITILDREVAESVAKFEKADTAKESYKTGTTVTVSELFKAATLPDKVTIDTDNVQVFVSAVDESSTVTGTYVADIFDWTKGTLTFSGIGAATITITDYNYCTPTTITVNVAAKNLLELLTNEAALVGADATVLSYDTGAKSGWIGGDGTTASDMLRRRYFSYPKVKNVFVDGNIVPLTDCEVVYRVTFSDIVSRGNARTNSVNLMLRYTADGHTYELENRFGNQIYGSGHFMQIIKDGYGTEDSTTAVTGTPFYADKNRAFDGVPALKNGDTVELRVKLATQTQNGYIKLSLAGNQIGEFTYTGTTLPEFGLGSMKLMAKISDISIAVEDASGRVTCSGEHTPGAWIVDTAAGLREEGSQYQECDVCGEALQTKPVPAIGGLELLTSDAKLEQADASVLSYDTATKEGWIGGDGTTSSSTLKKVYFSYPDVENVIVDGKTVPLTDCEISYYVVFSDFSATDGDGGVRSNSVNLMLRYTADGQTYELENRFGDKFYGSGHYMQIYVDGVGKEDSTTAVAGTPFYSDSNLNRSFLGVPALKNGDAVELRVKCATETQNGYIKLFLAGNQIGEFTYTGTTLPEFGLGSMGLMAKISNASLIVVGAEDLAN